MASAGLLVADFIICFMWVWSRVLIKIFVYKILELGHEPSGEVIKCALSVINMFFFAFWVRLPKVEPTILSPCSLVPFLWISSASSLTLVLESQLRYYCGSNNFQKQLSNNYLPGTLTADQKPQLSTTGFELASKASSSIDVKAPWNGRFWARTGCITNASGKFTCETADCGSGQVACNGNGAVPPASLVEINIAADGGHDFYDVSLVDGFNLPVSVATQGGTGDCQSSTCPADVNAVCPAELQVKGSDGSVIACKSACSAFNEPQYCCTGDHGTPQTCPATNYSMIFENQCPQAYSYVYDDQNSTFTCSGAPNYIITFCPA